MSRPRGYYVDQMSTWARGLTPLQDWAATVALVTLLAAVGLWLVSFIPLALLFWPEFDGANGFEVIYLTSVAVWVVPGAVWAALHGRRT